ncbi:MAG: restriction endonuclease [Cellulosilyticaceae bacterium]
MYSYYNLNDVEFESLCKDVLERMLSINLRIFSKGRDGGIDLTDNVKNPTVIVQVKHYIRSKFSDLKSTLKKETGNVEKWKPKKYYICCGMELTAANISEIYSMFYEYMETDRNIITLIEIDEFLRKEENQDIVRKHYKLWLYSSDILSQVYNQNIFIDCEALLDDIEEEAKFFVPTVAYEQCLKYLDKHRMIMIIGHPGVGKTITSKMLVLYYATKGYTVRYSTNASIADIKRSLSLEKDLKEIVLLDDCLGQHYFKMKENQESEITALAKYVRMNKNKMLILNSRITILNEARERYEAFNLFLNEKKIDKLTIDMDTISYLEKAKIFYNHLISKKVPQEYYERIRENKNYLRIIKHSNYTPRIIEYVTLKSSYISIDCNLFVNHILGKLSNPNDIWRNEYYQRLQKEDRAFLTTLYSLTDTRIECDILKKCFQKRLIQMDNIDYTLNNFELVTSRLNESIIKIVEDKHLMYVSVINPSVNDFLRGIFLSNSMEVTEIRKSFQNINQIDRCCSKEEFPDIIYGMICDGTILEIDFRHLWEKNYFITSYICSKKIQDIRYKYIIHAYLSDSFGYQYRKGELLSHFDILMSLLTSPLLEYYSILDILCEEVLSELLEDLSLKEAVRTINLLREYYLGLEPESECWFEDMCTSALEETIYNYVSDVDIWAYCESYDISKLINDNSIEHEYGVDVEEGEIVKTIKSWLKEDIELEVSSELDNLEYCPSTVRNIITIDERKDEIDDIVNSYMHPEPDYDEDDDYERGRGEMLVDEIEVIFERD